MSVELLTGLATTRSIRRFRPEPVSDDDLRTILFGATRAPSGSNRQPYRFVVLRDSDVARRAKTLIGQAARQLWGAKRAHDGYDTGSGGDADSPKSRLARAMQAFVDEFEHVPVVVLPCFVPYRGAGHLTDGASVYPACQNLLLAARALDLGAVMTIWHRAVDEELKAMLGIPDEVTIAATIALGRPHGGHGPVRRRPLAHFVVEDEWDRFVSWAADPPGAPVTGSRAPAPPT